jgi:hypothetical protein
MAGCGNHYRNHHHRQNTLSSHGAAQLLPHHRDSGKRPISRLAKSSHEIYSCDSKYSTVAGTLHT